MPIYRSQCCEWESGLSGGTGICLTTSPLDSWHRFTTSATVGLDSGYETRPTSRMNSKSKIQTISLLFGLGSWITITGFWAEVPLLTYYLPEGWTLSSKLTLAIQVANIGPLVYCICQKYIKWCNCVSATHAQMVIGVLSCLLLIFAWDQTVMVSGQVSSMYLMLAAFGLSLLDCTSSVTFLPFMARFQEHHLTPYLIGEGLSGFIPILVALIQGHVDEAPEECASNRTLNSTIYPDVDAAILFGPSIFFLSLLATLIISWAAFFYLLYGRDARLEQSKSPDKKTDEEITSNEFQTVSSKGEKGIHDSSISPVAEYIWLQAVIIYACLSTFGIFPSLQPYSTLPYGHWAMFYTALGVGIAYPIGCALAMIHRVESLKGIVLLTALGSVVSVYLLTLAIQSPEPLLLSHPSAGGSVSISCWIAYTLILSYVKTVVTVKMSQRHGESALFRVGIYTQVGSVLGAAFMYLAVNHFHFFSDGKV